MQTFHDIVATRDRGFEISRQIAHGIDTARQLRFDNNKFYIKSKPEKYYIDQKEVVLTTQPIITPSVTICIICDYLQYEKYKTMTYTKNTKIRNDFTEICELETYLENLS